MTCEIKENAGNDDDDAAEETSRKIGNKRKTVSNESSEIGSNESIPKKSHSFAIRPKSVNVLRLLCKSGFTLFHRHLTIETTLK